MKDDVQMSPDTLQSMYKPSTWQRLRNSAHAVADLLPVKDSAINCCCTCTEQLTARSATLMKARPCIPLAGKDGLQPPAGLAMAPKRQASFLRLGLSSKHLLQMLAAAAVLALSAVLVLLTHQQGHRTGLHKGREALQEPDWFNVQVKVCLLQHDAYECNVGALTKLALKMSCAHCPGVDESDLQKKTLQTMLVVALSAQ